MADTDIPKASALKFVVLIGIVSLFADPVVAQLASVPLFLLVKKEPA